MPVEDHPTDPFVVLVEGTAAASVADAVRALSEQLADRRRWVIGPPELLDDPDAVGIVLSLYNARPPWDTRIETATDRAHLEEVKELLGEFCRISREQDVSFVVDYMSESIGFIEDGRMDLMLESGLIGEWERVLAARDSPT